MRLTDGGIETVLIFDRHLELPCFAAFDLLRTPSGTEALRSYFDPYLAIARDHRAPFVLTAPTWRASPDWGERLGYTAAGLHDANRKAIALMQEIRADNADLDITVDAAVGPRGDGYVPSRLMSADEAEAYHAHQLAALTDADIVTALTINYVDEAIGIARAATTPVAISFTVETDGRLPSGQPLGEAIELTDTATGGRVEYFMVNCAHPEHFEPALDGPWVERIHGIRANASRLSHAELDESETLDGGDPQELAALYRRLKTKLPALELLGGCCGTDHRHVAEIARAWN